MGKRFFEVFACCVVLAGCNQTEGSSDQAKEDGGDDAVDGGADGALAQRCGYEDPGVQLPPCPEGFYCSSVPGGCPGSSPVPGNFAGFCVPVPDECAEEVDEVCGCDDVTYDNGCEMNMARAGVQFHDACDRHCTTNDDCADHETCARPTPLEPMENACDLSEGRCMDFSAACERFGDSSDSPQPVCGCDGTTYESWCDALREARTNIAKFSACEDTDGGGT